MLTIAEVLVEFHHKRVFLIWREVICPVTLVNEVSPSLFHQIIIYLIVMPHFIESYQIFFNHLPTSSQDIDCISDLVEQISKHHNTFINRRNTKNLYSNHNPNFQVVLG
jgi:hypothetical protein